MYERKLNGILADEMGLGKTIQTIALLAWLACEKGTLLIFYKLYHSLPVTMHLLRNMGSAFSCRPHISHAQLGNGIQEMVSFFQNSNLLRNTER